MKYTKYFCAKSSCPAKKFLAAGHIANFQTAPSRDGGPPIVLYEYRLSREIKHAAKFQDGFSGYLHITSMSRSADSIQHCGSLLDLLI